MDMHAQWVNKTRLPQEALHIEEVYTERLLDLFGDVASAYKAREEYHRQHEPVFHRWSNFNRISHMEACQNLLPSEKQLAHFVVKFEQ